MNKIEIKIVTKDQPYAHALAEALMKKEEFSSVTLLDQPIPEELLGSTEEKLNYPIIYLMEAKGPKKANCIYLKNRNMEGDRENLNAFYKYQSIGILYGKIIQLYFRMGGGKEAPLEDVSTKICTLFSLSGGSGTTSLALGLAQHFHRFEDKRVLYLTLEPHPEINRFFSSPKEKNGLKEFLYYFTQKKSEKIKSPKPFVVQDDYGVETFSQEGLFNPLLSLGKEQWREFLLFLSKEFSYDILFIDASNRIGPKVLTAFHLSHQVVFFKDWKDPRNQNLKTILEQERLANSERWVEVEREPDELFPEQVLSSEQESLCSDFIVPYDSRSFSGNEKEKKVLLDGSFGLWIKEFALKLTYI